MAEKKVQGRTGEQVAELKPVRAPSQAATVQKEGNDKKEKAMKLAQPHNEGKSKKDVTVPVAAGKQTGEQAGKQLTPVVLEADTQKSIVSLAKKGEVIIGSQAVLKQAKQGTVAQIYAASNCPALLEERLRYYSQTGGIAFQKLGVPSETLGELCGKPFTALVLGIRHRKK